MTSYLGKTVSVRGERGAVVAERKGKKGKLRVTVRFDIDGREEEMGYGLVTVREPCGPAIEFEPALTGPELANYIREDARRRRAALMARMRID